MNDKYPYNRKSESKSFDSKKSRDYVEKEVDDGTGGKVKVRYFNDGTSEVHWGGMGGV